MTVGITGWPSDFLSVVLFLQLYKSLICPVLEYSHSVWQLHHKTLCNEIEEVQLHATKLIPSIKDKECPDRLAALTLPSREHRQKWGDMVDANDTVFTKSTTLHSNWLKAGKLGTTA